MKSLIGRSLTMRDVNPGVVIYGALGCARWWWRGCRVQHVEYRREWPWRTRHCTTWQSEISRVKRFVDLLAKLESDLDRVGQNKTISTRKCHGQGAESWGATSQGRASTNTWTREVAEKHSTSQQWPGIFRRIKLVATAEEGWWLSKEGEREGVSVC
ncbi:hypothetical protein IF1G_08010 [Cordyceps javanica]|uniref:Uncharacterized protein n=1 Tax=Cordyceps javanica TaxID=43265 RepID=A0A545UVF8_9HYPO|nr:hypothetical protein IF1G_08010 [Cordyceps javanica]